jgi:hypothetical protein
VYFSQNLKKKKKKDTEAYQSKAVPLFAHLLTLTGSSPFHLKCKGSVSRCCLLRSLEPIVR